MLQLGTSGIFLNFQISLYCTAAEIKFFSHLKKKKKKLQESKSYAINDICNSVEKKNSMKTWNAYHLTSLDYFKHS